jgi:uncharacterized protein
MSPKNPQNRHIYLKTFTLRDTKDLDDIKRDIERKMIIIIRITPLAQKDVGDLKNVVEVLYDSVTSLGGDMARLGEERIILTPPDVKIWHGE